MRRPLEFTVAVALDANALFQFQRSWPTWRKHKPELADLSWLLIVDGRAGTPADWRRRLDPLDLPPYRLISWCWPDRDDCAPRDATITQAERMATAVLRVAPACCQTSHWIHVDPGTRAVVDGQWLDRRWFLPGSNPPHPCLVAGDGGPVPDEALDVMDAWAAGHSDTILSTARPRKGPVRAVDGWLAVAELGFSRLAAQLCFSGGGENRLPVPSLWHYYGYLAARLAVSVNTPSFTQAGWQRPPETSETLL